MSSDAPAIPLFGDAYLADTRHLSLEEHGAYLQLMMIAWRSPDCALPDDDTRLARMLGITAGRWSKLKSVVMAFWTLTDKGWEQKRLSKERLFVEKKRAQNKAAAEARWEAKSPEKIEDEECGRISGRNAPPPSPPQDKLEEEEASPPAREQLPIDESVDDWNAAAKVVGWPTVQRFTDKRRAALKARLRTEGRDGWKAAIVRARASPYLGQSPPPTWFTFDWITNPTNFVKLIEGNYDRNHSANAGGNGISRTLAASASVFGSMDERQPEAAGRFAPAGYLGTG